MKKWFKRKCKHDFTDLSGIPVDGGECNKCGKTWIEITDSNKNEV